MKRRIEGTVLLSALTIAAAVACTRTRDPSSTTTMTSSESDASGAYVPPPIPHRSADHDGLDPATAAAAERAVVPDTSDTVVLPTPLPRTAAPPTAPPTATPGAPRTGVPVIPEGHAAPVIVPAETPPGVPLPRTGDAGAR